VNTSAPCRRKHSEIKKGIDAEKKTGRGGKKKRKDRTRRYLKTKEG